MRRLHLLLQLTVLVGATAAFTSFSRGSTITHRSDSSSSSIGGSSSRRGGRGGGSSRTSGSWLATQRKLLCTTLPPTPLSASGGGASDSSLSQHSHPPHQPPAAATTALEAAAHGHSAVAGRGRRQGVLRTLRSGWTKLVTPQEYDRQIWELALPTLGAVLIDPCLSLVDTLFVGKLGHIALASMGPCTALYNMIFATASW